MEDKQLIRKNDKIVFNHVSQYARKVFGSDRAKTDGKLVDDAMKVFQGHAFYHKDFFCSSSDYRILRVLGEELKEQYAKSSGKMIKWSQHLKHENPDFSQTFQKIIQAMSEYFDVDVFASRLNFYSSGKCWKPYHHDSHAYSGGEKEDFTMGASFGAERKLSFLHVESGACFEFPQRNGEVFAFTSVTNECFQHGIPKSPGSGPRFSIIAWGRRRSLTVCNSGRDEMRIGRPISLMSEESKEKVSQLATNNPTLEETEEAISIDSVVEAIENLIISEDRKSQNMSNMKPRRRKGRVQGAWAQ